MYSLIIYHTISHGTVERSLLYIHKNRKGRKEGRTIRYYHRRMGSDHILDIWSTDIYHSVTHAQMLDFAIKRSSSQLAYGCIS